MSNRGSGCGNLAPVLRGAVAQGVRPVHRQALVRKGQRLLALWLPHRGHLLPTSTVGDRGTTNQHSTGSDSVSFTRSRHQRAPDLGRSTLPSFGGQFFIPATGRYGRGSLHVHRRPGYANAGGSLDLPMWHRDDPFQHRAVGTLRRPPSQFPCFQVNYCDGAPSRSFRSKTRAPAPGPCLAAQPPLGSPWRLWAGPPRFVQRFPSSLPLRIARRFDVTVTIPPGIVDNHCACVLHYMRGYYARWPSMTRCVLARMGSGRPHSSGGMDVHDHAGRLQR